MVSCRTGNYLRKVSYGDDTQWFHAGQETIREKFPVEMIHNGVMTRQETIREGVPMEMIHNSFMPRQETIREKFPMEMVHSVPMTGRKLFAKGFLWKWYTVCPRRTGNYSRRVSYGDDTQWFHARQETIREKFPMEVIRSVPTTDRKLFAKGFLWR